MSLALRLDYGRGTVDGTATLLLNNSSRTPARDVPILLGRLMTVSGVTDRAGREVSYSQRVTVFDDDSVRQVNAVTIRPPRGVGGGDSIELSVRYRGIVVGYTETGSVYIQDHVDREFTILRVDAFAFPRLGRASWVANRTIAADPFEFRASITVPIGLVVATGGVRQSVVTQDSTATWTYVSTEPVPFLNIAIARYKELEDGNSHIYYFGADSVGARTLQAAVGHAMNKYADWYGARASSPHLVVIEIPEGMGSQSSLPAGIIQTADAFRSKSELSQVYHELSHIWNPRDLERPSPRWNEGLASFLQWRMAEELDGWNAWDAQLERSVQLLMQRCAPPSPCGSVPMAHYGAANQTDRSYRVGLLMFNALYRTLGREAFDRAYRAFFQRHQSTGAQTSDLVAAFHAESPASDEVFRDWLTTSNWYRRLAAGETYAAIVASYAR